MKRIRVLGLALLLAAGLFTGTTVAAGEKGLQAPEAEIIIAGEKKSARFSHTVHLNLGVACGQCHHDSKHEPFSDKDIAVMENSQQLRCTTCHNQDFSNPDLQSLKDAFHTRCKECHKQGFGGKMGPTKCTDCHVK